MGRRIPHNVRLKVVVLYLKGEGLNEIAKKLNISKGSAVGIIEEMRTGTYPGIRGPRELFDELRLLSLGLKRMGLSLEKARTGFAVLESLAEMNVSPQDIVELPGICRDLTSDDYPVEEFIGATLTLRGIEKGYRKPFGDIVRDFETREEEADKAEKRLKRAEKSLKEVRKALSLRHRELGLMGEIESLRKERDESLREAERFEEKRRQALERYQGTEHDLATFRSLRDQLKSRGIDLSHDLVISLLALVKTHEGDQLLHFADLADMLMSNELSPWEALERQGRLRELEGRGFDDSALKIFQKELDRRGKNMSDVMRYLASFQDKYGSLTGLEAGQRRKLKELERKIDTIRRGHKEKEKDLWKLVSEVGDEKKVLEKLKEERKETEVWLSEVDANVQNLEKRENDVRERLSSTLETEKDLESIQRGLEERFQERKSLESEIAGLEMREKVVRERLASILETEENLDAIQEGLEDKLKEKQDLETEIAELEEKKTTMSEQIQASEFLERAIQGDVESAKAYLRWLCNGTYTLIGDEIAVPRAEKAKEWLVKKVAEILDDRLVPRWEHDLVTRKAEKEIREAKDRMNQEGTRLESQITSLTRQRDELKTGLSEAVNERDEIESSLVLWQRTVSSLQGENDLLKLLNKVLSQKMRNQKSEGDKSDATHQEGVGSS